MAPSPKGVLWATSLDLARRSSLFSSSRPCDASGRVVQGGSAGHEGLDWKEVVRKFQKHNPNRPVTAQAALLDLLVHNALARSSRQAGYSPSSADAALFESLGGPSVSVPPKSTASWPPAVTAEADVKAIQELVTALDSSVAKATDATAFERTSATIVKAFAQYALGEYDACLTSLRDVDKAPPSGPGWEGYDLTLRVAASTLEGEVYERQGALLQSLDSYEKAGRTYDEGLDLVQRGRGNKIMKETDKWGEQSIFRACYLARLTRSISLAFASHRLYIRHSEHFSASGVPPSRRLIVHSSYRSILHLLGPSTLSPQAWRTEASSNNRAQEAVLRSSTSFPKAGEVNFEYLEFIDGVVEGWRVLGSGKEGTGEIVKILYNALTHTYQSQRLLRHLIHVLTAKGSYDEACRALKLYVEYVTKTRETDARTVDNYVRKFRREEEEAKLAKKALSSSRGPEKTEKAAANGAPTNGDVDEDHGPHDIDSPEDAVETFCFGIRVLCKYTDDPETAIKLSDTAKEIYDQDIKEKAGANPKLEATVERCLGVARGALAQKLASAERRPKLHTAALAHLQNAAELDPSSWENAYHLAFQLFELRQIEPALEYARLATELDGEEPKSGRVEAWHLLALILTAQGDHAGAAEVFDATLKVLAEKEEDDDPSETSTPAEADKTNGSIVTGVLSRVRNGAASLLGAPSVNGERPAGYTSRIDLSEELNKKLTAFPAVATLKATVLAFPKDDLDVLGSKVQMRVSWAAVVEKKDGADAGLSEVLNVLSFWGREYQEFKSRWVDDEEGGLQTIPLTEPFESTALQSRRASRTPSIAASSVRPSQSLISGIRRRSVADRSTVNQSQSNLQVPDATATSPSIRSGQLGARRPASVVTPRNFSSVSLVESTSATLPPSFPRLATEGKAGKLQLDLKLLEAAALRRGGKMSEAKEAISEAEFLDPSSPDVWVQYGIWAMADKQWDLARTSLMKALAFDVGSLPANTLLARLYLTVEAYADPLHYIAENLLDPITKGSGWDVSECWYELSRVYGATARPKEQKEALVWALQLEETKGIRPLLQAVPRCI